jgi:hypothetical protein
MNLRFTDSNGREHRITDAAAFNWMVETGQIRADTMLFDERLMAWRRAGGMPEFHAAAQRLNPHTGQPTDLPPYGEVPLYGVPSSEAVYSATQAAPQPPPSVLFGSARDEPPPQNHMLSLVGLLALIAGVLLILFSTVKFSPTPYAAGYRIGQTVAMSLAPAIIAFLLWRFAFDKKKGTGLLIFGIGFLGICALQSVNAARDSKANRLATEDVDLLIQKAMSGQPVEAKDYDEQKYGAAAPLLTIINEYVAGIQSESLKMNEEMSQLQLETLLAEQTLRDAERISGGQARLKKMREIMNRYEALFKRKAEELPARVLSSSIDEKLKQDFLRGFNSTKDQDLAQLSELFEIERRFASKADEILSFVKARQGQYKFIGSNIMFKSGRDEAEFNNLSSEIGLIAQEEIEWQERSQRQMRRKYEDFKKATGKR